MTIKELAAAGALGVALLGLTAGTASAVTVQYIGGNECGQASDGNPAPGFTNCTAYNGVTWTPTIIKFNPDGSVDDISTNFASVTGEEFVFTNVTPTSGTFTYTQGAGDPFITAFAVKFGNGYDLYTDMGAAFATYSWTNSTGQATSHITFFDTAAPIPVPAAGLLLLTALGGLGLWRRRQSAA